MKFFSLLSILSLSIVSSQGGGPGKGMMMMRGGSGGPGMMMDSNGGGYFCPINTYASGVQEVNPVNTSTSGLVSLMFSRDLSYLDFVLDVYKGKNITQAHLHCGGPGVGGPIILYLFGFDANGVNVNGQLSSGTLTAESIVPADPTNSSVQFQDIPTCGLVINNIASLYEAVLQRKVYLNVHSVANPPGEVRGQVINMCSCGGP